MVSQMALRLAFRPAFMVGFSTAVTMEATALADDMTFSASPELSYVRREKAAKVLTIANAVEPEETAAALKLARSSMRQEPLSTIEPEEKVFLRHTLKEGVARGIACAAGGAVASYAVMKVVLLIIPLVPSPYVTRAAMSAVSFGAAVLELAAFPDVTTIELLLMKNSGLGTRARKTIEAYNPDLLLLATLDRQTHSYRHSGNLTPHEVALDPTTESGYYDREMHFR